MNVLKHVDNHMDDLILDLQKLIQQPSVSAKNEGIEECAKLVKKLLKSSGVKSEILRLKKGVDPIVFGEIIMMFSLLNLLIYGMTLLLAE